MDLHLLVDSILPPPPATNPAAADVDVDAQRSTTPTSTGDGSSSTGSAMQRLGGQVESTLPWLLSLAGISAPTRAVAAASGPRRAPHSELHHAPTSTPTRPTHPA